MSKKKDVFPGNVRPFVAKENSFDSEKFSELFLKSFHHIHSQQYPNLSFKLNKFQVAYWGQFSEKDSVQWPFYFNKAKALIQISPKMSSHLIDLSLGSRDNLIPIKRDQLTKTDLLAIKNFERSLGASIKEGLICSLYVEQISFDPPMDAKTLIAPFHEKDAFFTLEYIRGGDQEQSILIALPVQEIKKVRSY